MYDRHHTHKDIGKQRLDDVDLILNTGCSLLTDLLLLGSVESIQKGLISKTVRPGPLYLLRS